MILALLLSLTVPGSARAVQIDVAGRDSDGVGLLVMAHGGDEDWNDAVLETTAPVAKALPTVVAFGMADPVTLKTALDSLQGLGVDRVAVVRMFLSGASFLDQTEYLLGISREPPAVFGPSHAGQPAAHAASPGAIPAPLDHHLELATHPDGMVDAGEVADIVVQRALEASDDPSRESVLLLAHGMGDEPLNDELLAAMAEIEQDVAAQSFAAVHSATLREDWADARAAAEQEIRALVRGEGEQGRRVIVVPVRLSGFGPYADVLEGLDYVAGEGLLPNTGATEWIERMACAILCAEGWDSPLMAMMVQ
ncbi:MAG: hypothetical protein PVJ80_03845 [Gemmatimonadota bacterium]